MITFSPDAMKATLLAASLFRGNPDAFAYPLNKACVYRADLNAARADIPNESLWNWIVPNYWWTGWLKSREALMAEGRYEADVDAVGLDSAAWFVHPYEEVQDALSLWKDPDVIRGWIDEEIRLETGACREWP